MSIAATRLRGEARERLRGIGDAALRRGQHGESGGACLLDLPARGRLHAAGDEQPARSAGQLDALRQQAQPPGERAGQARGAGEQGERHDGERGVDEGVEIGVGLGVGDDHGAGQAADPRGERLDAGAQLIDRDPGQRAGRTAAAASPPRSS